MNQEYIVTIRQGLRDPKDDSLVASECGVDFLLNTNSKGRLIFPDDLFQEAKKILDDATA